MLKDATTQEGKRMATLHLPLNGKERLARVRALRGMWKEKKSEPIKELHRIRRGWDRTSSRG